MNQSQLSNVLLCLVFIIFCPLMSSYGTHWELAFYECLKRCWLIDSWKHDAFVCAIMIIFTINYLLSIYFICDREGAPINVLPIWYGMRLCEMNNFLFFFLPLFIIQSERTNVDKTKEQKTKRKRIRCEYCNFEPSLHNLYCVSCTKRMFFLERFWVKKLIWFSFKTHTLALISSFIRITQLIRLTPFLTKLFILEWKMCFFLYFSFGSFWFLNCSMNSRSKSDEHTKHTHNSDKRFELN